MNLRITYLHIYIIHKKGKKKREKKERKKVTIIRTVNKMIKKNG